MKDITSLKGKAWVLKELLLWLKSPPAEDSFKRVILKIAQLTSQAPVSELAPSDEDRRKAEILKELEKEIQKMSDASILEKSDKELIAWAGVLIRFIKECDTELLAQEESDSCPVCKGRGQLRRTLAMRDCLACGGTGKLKEEK